MNQHEIFNIVVGVIFVMMNNIIIARRLAEMKPPNILMQIMFLLIEFAIVPTVFVTRINVTAELLILFIDYQHTPVAGCSRFIFKKTHLNSPFVAIGLFQLTTKIAGDRLTRNDLLSLLLGSSDELILT